MIVVRATFVAKPGQAGKLAAHMKEMVSLGGLKNPRVMTDLAGDFNQVVMEHEVDSLADFEKTHAEYMRSPAIREKAGAYLDMWVTGKREFFTVA